MSDSIHLGQIVRNFISTPPNNTSPEVKFGKDIKKFLGSTIAAILIWKTGRPLSMGLLIVGAGLLRNQSLDRHPKYELLSKGTLLPMLQGAYIAAMFMPLATAFQAAKQSSTLLRKAATLVIHPLIFNPGLFTGFMWFLDAGSKPETRLKDYYNQYYSPGEK